MPYADVADVVWPVTAGNLGFLLAPVGWHRMVYVRRPGLMEARDPIADFGQLWSPGAVGL